MRMAMCNMGFLLSRGMAGTTRKNRHRRPGRCTCVTKACGVAVANCVDARFFVDIVPVDSADGMVGHLFGGWCNELDAILTIGHAVLGMFHGLVPTWASGSHCRNAPGPTMIQVSPHP